MNKADKGGNVEHRSCNIMAVVRSTAYCSVYLRRSRRMNWATEKGCCHPIHVVVRQFRNVAVADWFAPGTMCIERVEWPIIVWSTGPIKEQL